MTNEQATVFGYAIFMCGPVGVAILYQLGSIVCDECRKFRKGTKK